MTLFLKRSMQLYRHVMVDMADPRTDSLFLVRSPVQLAFLIVSYLLFVYEIGPRIMEKRKAFKLKKVLMGFNSLQMIANAYLLYAGVPIIARFPNKFCEPIDYGSSEVAITLSRLVWIYYLLKVVDLFDTIFFVLRKKENQVTFLHVYHHSVMVFVCWLFSKYFGGGHTVVIGFFNAIVHIFMYGYYLLAAMDTKYKKKRWIKRFITQLQLVQFAGIYLAYVPMLFMPSCQYPKKLLLVFLPQNTMMVMLFCDFYYRNYIEKKAIK